MEKSQPRRYSELTLEEKKRYHAEKATAWRRANRDKSREHCRRWYHKKQAQNRQAKIMKHTKDAGI